MDSEIKEMRGKIATIYDGLSQFKRNLFYTVLIESILFRRSLNNDTLPSSKLFIVTLREDYTPNEDVNFGTVLDKIRTDNNPWSTVNTQTHSVYSGLLHIITSIKDNNKIKSFHDRPLFMTDEMLNNVNAILAIKPNAPVVSLEHPTTVSSSAAMPDSIISSSASAGYPTAASLSQQYSYQGVNLPPSPSSGPWDRARTLSLRSSSEIPPHIRHLFTSKDTLPFKIYPYIISKDGYKKRKITTSPEQITYLDRFVTFTSDILITPGNAGYERKGIISGHGTPITVTIDGCKYNVPTGSTVLVRVFEDFQGPGRSSNITKQIKPTIIIPEDEPSSCAISGGAGRRRRRGTKRVRRGRRRSSRKN